MISALAAAFDDLAAAYEARDAGRAEALAAVDRQFEPLILRCQRAYQAAEADRAAAAKRNAI